MIVRDLELHEADPDVVQDRFAGLYPLAPLHQDGRHRQLPRVVYTDAVRLA